MAEQNPPMSLQELGDHAKAKLASRISGCERSIYSRIERSVDAYFAASAGAPWRCFHCDEVFTDRAQAAIHFGTHERHHPGCQIDVAEYRRMAQVCESYGEEDAEIHRLMRRQEFEHAAAVRRAEEAGYARGLHDAFAGQAGRAISELLTALRDMLGPFMTSNRENWPEVEGARAVVARYSDAFECPAVPSGWRWEIVPTTLAEMARLHREENARNGETAGTQSGAMVEAAPAQPGGQWTAVRWVSDPAMLHLSGPNNTECDVREDDASEEGRFLNALAQFLSVGVSPALRAYQTRVAEWLAKCFVPTQYLNMVERGDRLLEEVLELLQAHGYDSHRVATLVEYVYGRPVGEPVQEMGGVMVTLAAFATVAGLDMAAAGETELARISLPEVMEKVRIKQESKDALHFDTPLPGHA